jgi:hypothetical protein
MLLLRVYVPLVAVVAVVPVVLPLVTLKPLLTLRETPETAFPLTASVIVPVTVPPEQVLESRIKLAVTVWFSVARVANWVALM